MNFLVVTDNAADPAKETAQIQPVAVFAFSGLPFDVERPGMDKRQVESELSTNRLCFVHKGIEAIPAPLIMVGSYAIGGPDDEDLDAIIYAYTDKRSDNKRVYCCSFMVRIGSGFTYYYRDSLFQIEDLVTALRIRNGYKGSTG